MPSLGVPVHRGVGKPFAHVGEEGGGEDRILGAPQQQRGNFSELVQLACDSVEGRVSLVLGRERYVFNEVADADSAIGVWLRRNKNQIYGQW
jgi:hypothetical protein